MSRSNLSTTKYTSHFPNLGIGVGLRPTHYSHVLEHRHSVSWFEAISENYMGIEGGSGGRPIHVLEKVRADHPIVLHGVSLSIGSTDPINKAYLEKLKLLFDRIQPAWVSDHLCWTGVEGENLHDLLPLPYTEETLDHLASRILQVQDHLSQRMLFENVSSYLSFEHSEMTEWEFISELSKRSDCGILLDINNIYVSAINQGFDPKQYLDGIPRDRVGQMHLAGHSNQGKYLLDTHDHPVTNAVWDLYREALKKFGPVSTLIEWDAQIPEFQVLEAEAARAKGIQVEELGKEVAIGTESQQSAFSP